MWCFTLVSVESEVFLILNETKGNIFCNIKVLNCRPGRKLGNFGNLGNLRNFFSEFFKSEFSILAVGQNRKLGKKKLGIIFPRFPRFPTFPSFRFATFSFSFLFFFSLFINVFSKFLFYICNYSLTLYFINTVRLS